MKKLMVCVALALAGIAGLPAVAGATDPAADEAAFVQQINALRSSKGLPALAVHPNLTEKARGWSATMAGEGRIWHSKLSDGITADWLKLGENVGMGGGVDSLHAAFVASPKHYENLIDPNFGYVGIGVVYKDGTLYVTESFMKLATAPAAPAAPPAPVVAAAAPVTTTTTAAPKPVAPKPKPAPAPAPAETPAEAPTTPAEAPVAAAEAPAPSPAPEAPKPSPLLVSVLERLRDFT